MMLLTHWTPLRILPNLWQKMTLWLCGLIFTWSLWLAPALATGVYDLPILEAGSNSHIIDVADSISFANEGKLNRDLQNLTKETGQEVRMVVIRRLDFDSTIDSFADDVFSRWYPDAESQQNQTLLVMDTLTNSTAVRRGATAATLLTDEIIDSLRRETLAQPLRNGAKYNQALLAADKRLVPVLSGLADPGPPDASEINLEGTFATAEETDDRSATIWVVVLLALATLIPMVTYFWYVGNPGG